MATAWLQFQGTNDTKLLMLLLGAVAAVLLAAGIRQLLRRNLRQGAICLSAALGPVALAPALLADAVIRYSRRPRQPWRSSLAAAGAVTATALLAAAFVLASGRTPGAFWMAAVGVELSIAVGVFYWRVYAYLRLRRLAVLTALRCAAILALLGVMFKPVISIIPGDSHKPLLTIMVDRSGSMSACDDANPPNRYTLALRALRLQEERIERHFRPVWRHFAAEPGTAGSLATLNELTASGAGTDSTNIAAAVTAAAGAHKRSELAGLVIVSDGNHTAADSVQDSVVVAGLPIYTVGVGDENESLIAHKNIQLVSADAPLQAVKNNLATITARVKLTGIANAQIDLLDETGGPPLDSRELHTTRNSEIVTVHLKWNPADPPTCATAADKKNLLRRLRLRIGLQPDEAISQDNQTELHFQLISPRLRVLYIEGALRPEYKYLRRFLGTDPNVQFMGLIRTHGQTFQAQGGIDGKRLNWLPTNEADFAMLDVLIVGDVERNLLTREQMSQIGQFVNDGGALLMLGGQRSFGPGGYGGTEIERILPVTVGPKSQPQESTRFVPQLTAAGQAHGIFDGIAGYFPGAGGRKPDATAAKLPDLLGCVTVVGAKRAASVLAVHPACSNDAGPLVVLAVQQFGAGRTAAFTADTTWQWRQHLQGRGIENPYQRFWGQLIRWLANVRTKARDGTPPSVVARLGRSYVRAGQTVNLLARVQDAKGRLPTAATATCEITSDNPTEKIAPKQLVRCAESGLFRLSFQPAQPGTYRLKTSAVDAAGKSLGTDELTLTVAAAAGETDRLARNADLLRQMATQSDGRYADISAMPELIRHITDRQQARAAFQPQTRNYPLFNFALLFLVIVVLLTAEWALRRRWQLH